MSSLNTLKDKEPKEVARLLTVVSSSLLPNPGVGDVIHQTGKDSEFVKAVLSEIRDKLRIRDEDYSAQTQSRIYALLSEEISKAALANTNISSIKSRLGDKGELHPSQYQVKFDKPSLIEDLGNKKSNIVDVVTRPDKLTHLQAKYLLEEHDPRITISIKFVNSNKSENRFILFVISHRMGQVQLVRSAFRGYLSDVDLNNANEPIDVVKSFADSFGLLFKLGKHVSRFMHNEMVSLEHDVNEKDILMKAQMRPLDGPKGNYYFPYVFGGNTNFHAPDNEVIGEVVLGFVIDISKYVETLRKHNVHINSEDLPFLRI